MHTLPWPISDDQPDAGSEMSFPASDPPSYSQPTIGDGDEEEDDGPDDGDGPDDEDGPKEDKVPRPSSHD